MFGLLLQAVTCILALYWAFSDSEVFWALYVSGGLVAVELLRGVLSGRLTSGITTVIICTIVGSFFTTPWWHGAIVANAVMSGLESLFGLAIIAISLGNQDKAM